MSEVIKRLNAEHRNIAKLLDLLDTELATFHAGEQPDFELMLDIMDYLTHYPDTFHHPKEDLLFSRLRQLDASSHHVVEKLRKEHESLAREGIEFRNALRGMVNDEALMLRNTLEHLGTHYAEALRSHLDTEEAQVFPHALEVLKPADWKEIDERICQRDDPLFGKAVAVEFQDLFEEILRLEADDRRQGANAETA